MSSLFLCSSADVSCCIWISCSLLLICEWGQRKCIAVIQSAWDGGMHKLLSIRQGRVRSDLCSVFWADKRHFKSRGWSVLRSSGQSGKSLFHFFTCWVDSASEGSLFHGHYLVQVQVEFIYHYTALLFITFEPRKPVHSQSGYIFRF